MSPLVRSKRAGAHSRASFSAQRVDDWRTFDGANANIVAQMLCLQLWSVARFSAGDSLTSDSR
jgi:hypothetical protein